MCIRDRDTTSEEGKVVNVLLLFIVELPNEKAGVVELGLLIFVANAENGDSDFAFT